MTERGKDNSNKQQKNKCAVPCKKWQGGVINNFLKNGKMMRNFLLTTMLFCVLFNDSLANTWYPDVNVDNIPTVNETRKYNTEDGGYYKVKVNNTNYVGVFNVDWYKYDANGNMVASNRRDFNYALNGDPSYVGWGRTVLNFDENGNFLGEMNGREQNQQGSPAVTTPINSSSYTDSEKVLTYNKQGQLIGAFNDFFDYIAGKYVGGSANPNMIDSDGNYYERDSYGNVTDVYYQNGTRGPHTTYKYDGVGNITEKYEDGKLIYAKKRYTPAEAAAAVHDGNDNVVSITW